MDWAWCGAVLVHGLFVLKVRAVTQSCCGSNCVFQDGGIFDRFEEVCNLMTLGPGDQILDAMCHRNLIQTLVAH